MGKLERWKAEGRRQKLGKAMGRLAYRVLEASFQQTACLHILLGGGYSGMV
ncbi:MAG: hypothetical protein RQM92_04445 [Candidatus Syntrophopropionicum ammoniitolerans]